MQYAEQQRTKYLVGSRCDRFEKWVRNLQTACSTSGEKQCCQKGSSGNFSRASEVASNAAARAITASGVARAAFARAIATATGLVSMPAQDKPFRRAASSEVPQPQKGSKRYSPGTASRRYVMGKERGNLVK